MSLNSPERYLLSMKAGLNLLLPVFDKIIEKDRLLTALLELPVEKIEHAFNSAKSDYLRHIDALNTYNVRHDCLPKIEDLTAAYDSLREWFKEFIKMSAISSDQPELEEVELAEDANVVTAQIFFHTKHKDADRYNTILSEIAARREALFSHEWEAPSSQGRSYREFCELIDELKLALTNDGIGLNEMSYLLTDIYSQLKKTHQSCELEYGSIPEALKHLEALVEKLSEARECKSTKLKIRCIESFYNFNNKDFIDATYTPTDNFHPPAIRSLLFYLHREIMGSQIQLPKLFVTTTRQYQSICRLITTISESNGEALGQICRDCEEIMQNIKFFLMANQVQLDSEFVTALEALHDNITLYSREKNLQLEHNTSPSKRASLTLPIGTLIQTSPRQLTDDEDSPRTPRSARTPRKKRTPRSAENSPRDILTQHNVFK